MPRAPIGPPPELPPLVDNMPRTGTLPAEVVEPLRYRLRLVNKRTWTVELVGEDDITVGCGNATIRVPDAGGVSRVHLRLYWKGGRWSFEDVSTNGVHELDSHGVRTGQRVRGVNGWLPDRGYSIGGTELWMELVPTKKRAALGFEGLVGESEAMRTVYKLIQRLGQTDATVLIHGASGTGKELAAAAIHNLSQRRPKDMRKVNCAQLRGDLTGSMLFGHVKGAFTGADRDQVGLFEAAHGSTLFLDEIAELPLDTQAELLRVMETGQLTRVGSHEVIDVDVRIIAASHQHLAERVRAGKFREDLYARLNVITLRLPPLSERAEDIPLLVEHFMREVDPNRRITWSKAGLALVQAQSLPHNVRGVRNIVKRTVFFKPNVTVIGPEHVCLDDDVPVPPAKPILAADDPNYVYIPGKTLDRIKDEVIEKTLKRHGKQEPAARELDISRATLQRWVKPQPTE